MDKTTFYRLVAYAKNPQLVSKLDEFCQQNRCSISQGINQLLEQALGLTSLDNTADVPSASTSNSVDDTAQISIKTKVNQLERKVDDLRSAVNELRVAPSAMPSASTVQISATTSANTTNNVTKSVELGDGMLASTADSIDGILAKLEEIQRHLIRELKDLEDRIIIQQSERNQENFNHTHD